MFDPRQHTVPIYEFAFNEYVETKPGTAELRGSGVFVEFEGKLFVITAAHVLEGGISRIGFGYRDGDRVWVGHTNNAHILTAVATQFERDPRRARYKDDVDIAVIVPTPELADHLLAAYAPMKFTLDYQNHHPKDFVVCGWPGEFNICDPYNDRLFFQPFSIETPAGEPAELELIGGNPRTQFALRYDSSGKFQTIGGELVDMPRSLHGMSGGGVWAVTEENVSQRVDCAEFLYGIVVEDHNPTHPLLKAVHIDHVVAPLCMGLGAPEFNIADRVIANSAVGHVIDWKSGESEWIYKISFAKVPTFGDPSADWIPQSALSRAP